MRFQLGPIKRPRRTAYAIELPTVSEEVTELFCNVSSVEQSVRSEWVRLGSKGGIRSRSPFESKPERFTCRTGDRLQSSLRFWERGAQNRGKERHLVGARWQPSDELFQAVVQQ
jgi:hypothetical protein